MLNGSIRYHDGELFCDQVRVQDIIRQTGTPVYIYSLKRIRQNLDALRSAFADLQPHIHYSAKANANLAVLRTVIAAGAGVDAVSGGEIARAIAAGANAEQIVFAGVGKTAAELRYAVEHDVGWVNIENRRECDLLNEIAGSYGKRMRVALRYNPDVKANTHPHIATGHKGAKFGLNRDDLLHILAHRNQYQNLAIEGIHVHVGSQLGDTRATEAGVQATLDLIANDPDIHTINIGGGFPAAYDDEVLPSFTAFAQVLTPLLAGYEVIIEPGRSIVADAGTLITELLYTKAQGGVTLYIVDASMTDLLRPALYHAHHQIVPLRETNTSRHPVTVVGPVCETTDVLGWDVPLPDQQPGDQCAVLDAGAYGMVMASNYNQRPRPPEVVVDVDGCSWEIARRRETYDDLLRTEQPLT